MVGELSTDVAIGGRIPIFWKQGIHSIAQALGRRAHVRLERTLPTAQQGLRTSNRLQRINGPCIITAIFAGNSPDSLLEVLGAENQSAVAAVERVPAEPSAGTELLTRSKAYASARAATDFLAAI